MLYRWLDCCGPTSGQPSKRYCEYKEVKDVFGFVAEVTVSDDRTAIFPIEAKLSEEMHYG